MNRLTQDPTPHDSPPIIWALANGQLTISISFQPPEGISDEAAHGIKCMLESAGSIAAGVVRAAIAAVNNGTPERANELTARIVAELEGARR